MKNRNKCLMIGVLSISGFCAPPNQLKAAENTKADIKADIIDKYVLKDQLELNKINTINGEDKTTSDVKTATSKIVQNSSASKAGEVGSIIAVNIVNNGIKNLACNFKILEKSENGNFGTVQVGNDDVNNNAIPKSTVGTIVIPNEISDVNGGKYKVTSIGEFAFFNCSSITSTGLENNTTINSIGAKAFKDCSSLTSTGLEKNSTITSVDSRVFEGCSSITSTGLETNTGINYLGTNMFKNCTSLTSTGLEANTTVTKLGLQVFTGCSSLTSTGLGMNKTLTNLEKGTFIDCTSLTSTGLETNKNLTSIEAGAFLGCTSLTSTGLETNTMITEIMDRVFENCTSLTNTGLGTNTTITKIGAKAFCGDTKLQNVVFLIDKLPDMASDTFLNSNAEIYYLPEATNKPTIASTGANAVHELSVQNIILKDKASKLNYIEGETFDPSGLVIELKYNNGKSEVIKYNDSAKANFTFDKTEVSLKDTEITVTCVGKTITLPITVVKKKVVNTKVIRNIDKVDYIEGETFDPKGLEIEVKYNNGKIEVIKYNDTTKANFTFDKTKLSLKDTKITVTYGGQTVTLPISVIKETNAKEKGSKDINKEINKNINTGDIAQPMFYLGLMVLSGYVLGFKFKKKSKQ